MNANGPFFCSDNELRVTLWGDQSVSFTVEHLNTQDNPKVVVGLFVGCMPRKWYSGDITDRPYVSGGSACHYYLNPAIKEADPFYDRSTRCILFVSLHVHSNVTTSTL